MLNNILPNNESKKKFKEKFENVLKLIKKTQRICGMLLNNVLFSAIYNTKHLYKKKENSQISDLSYLLKN